MNDFQDPFAAFAPDAGAAPPVAGTAGAANGGPGERAAPPSLGGDGTDVPLALDALTVASLNPLVALAVPLLIAAPRIRATARHPNPTGLKTALAEGITQFETQARSQGLPNEQIIAARYILCTFLDESAASTPWGGGGAWSAKSLLVQFHNETWGGEKVFQLLSKLADNVQGNRNLLELLYVVLAFGFEGRFRVMDNGASQLEDVRRRLVQLLHQGQVGTEKALSPRWRGVEVKDAGWGRGLPLWAIAAATALLLACIFLVMRFLIGLDVEPTVRKLSQLDARPTPAVPKVVPQKPRLSNFLQPEIKEGLLSVDDYPDRSVVVIKSDGFFDPGKAQIAAPVVPLLGRIAAALNQLPGAITVVGHTDNRPIHSGLFPNNQVLSQRRAEAVAGELAKTVPPTRMHAEGHSDSEPVTENTTPAGRARNRRVEITLNQPQEAK